MTTQWVRVRGSSRPRQVRAQRKAIARQEDAIRPPLRTTIAAGSDPHADAVDRLLRLQDAVGNSVVARSREVRRDPSGRSFGILRKAKPAVPEGSIPSSKLRKWGTADQTQFMRKVYEAQLGKSVRDPTKQFSKGLEDDEKAEVESGQELRKDVAPDAQKLLAAARADLSEAKRKGETVAKTVISIGIGSAYRPLSRDFSAWQDAFKTRYGATEDERAELPGGEHGPAAVALMVTGLYSSKAIPGFSKHSKGLAIDFTTTQGRWNVGPSGSQADGWKKTWLFRWLQVHAADYGFEPYEKEPWHWNHTDKSPERGPKAAAEAASSELAEAIAQASSRGLTSP